MIPRADIEVEQCVDLDALIPPGSGTVEYPGWLGIQADYDPEIFGDSTWDLAEGLIAEEREALAGLIDTAADPSQFDEQAYEVFEMERPLELGVYGLSTALNAAGCVTGYSCRGHPGIRDYPQVLLAADTDRASVLVELCRETQCGIGNFETSGLAIFAPSAEELVELAAAVCREKARFPPRAI